MEDRERTGGQLLQEVEDLQRRIEAVEQQAREHHLLHHRFFQIASRHGESRAILADVLAATRDFTGCAAVGIRLRDQEGRLPYAAEQGFSPAFHAGENGLSMATDRCMCVNVIRGETDATSPSYTPGGSFYSNGLTRHLAAAAETEKGKTRNACSKAGYESIALVPIRSEDETLGLIHLADPRENMVPLEKVEFLEDVADLLAATIQRLRAEDALRASEQRLKNVINSPLVAVGIGDASGRITEVNDAFVRLLGYSREDLLSGKVTWRALTPPEYVNLDEQSMAELERTGQFGPYEKEKFRKDGTRVPILVGAARLPGAGTEHVAYLVDITAQKQAEEERRRLEAQILQTQKLESLGVLAGGIAHDFNNILAGIMGYADLALVRLPPSEPVRADLEVIKTAVWRAADLTRQMLAYSGTGKFIVEAVNLSQVVEDGKKMFAISISKKAAVTCNLAADLPLIQADAAQMQQVVVNLVMNACEALGKQGGEISISTHSLRCEAKELAGMVLGQDLPAGLYACLEVADTGCGMDEQTLARIFDPFFTTRFTGRGLGLAAVHGIVRGHKGAIDVSSAPGKGTTFRVLFPASAAAISPARS